MKIDGKEITIYPGTAPDAPLIVMNSYRGDGSSVVDAAKRCTSKDFSMVNISGLSWDDDMTPWPCPPISPDDTACRGKAGDYMKQLEDDILQEVLKSLAQQGFHPSWIGIVGYSLGGLFAVWSMYQTSLFDRVASVSGSLWFPGFIPYATETAIKRKPSCLYLSIGSKESKVRNSYLQTTENNTRKLYEWYQNHGIPSTFDLNPGNHFVHAAERMGKGIAWILQH